MRSEDNHSESEDIVRRVSEQMQTWGITVTQLARELNVSRQYVWQIVRGGNTLSLQRAQRLEAGMKRLVGSRTHLRTFGDRLRAARIASGLTLKQAAAHIGYSWVGVQRWEKNQCVPHLGVIQDLSAFYRSRSGKRNEGAQGELIRTLHGDRQRVRFFKVPGTDRTRRHH